MEGIEIDDDELAVIAMALEHFLAARISGTIKKTAKTTLDKINEYLGPDDEASDQGDGSEGAISSDAMLGRVLGFLKKAPVSARFGPEKVFISEIWNAVGGRSGWSMPQFKEWLVDQNRQRKLTLARADLVGAMNPRQVAESEIRSLGASFHFVLDPAAHQRRY